MNIILPDKKALNPHSLAKLLTLLRMEYLNADVAVLNYLRELQNMNQDVAGLVFLKVFQMMQLKRSKILHMVLLEPKLCVLLVMRI